MLLMLYVVKGLEWLYVYFVGWVEGFLLIFYVMMFEVIDEE